MIEPTPLPTDYTCPEGSVPGWLNADGLPTGCVTDLPLVEPLPERTTDPNQPELIPPIDICLTDCGPAAPDQLADTGSIDALLPIVVLAAVFIAAGGTIMRGARRRIGGAE